MILQYLVILYATEFEMPVVALAIGHLPRSRDLDLGEALRARLQCLQFTRQLF